VHETSGLKQPYLECSSGEKLATRKQRRRVNLDLDSGNKMSINQPALFFQGELKIDSAFGSNRKQKRSEL
jgi:hypothetical protein